MHLTRIVGTALVVTWLVDRIERAVNRMWQGDRGEPVPGPEIKAFGTLALAAGLAAAQGVLDLRTLAMESVAVAGTASILHDLQSQASTSADSNILTIASLARPARPRGVG